MAALYCAVVDAEKAWEAAERVEAWAGEVRVNFVRLVAIAVFYGHHLIQVYVVKRVMPARFHLTVSAIAVAWTLAALALHVVLARRWNPPWLKYAAAAWDATMATAVLLVYDGPKSPLLPLLFLLIATAPLRMNLKMVWATTLLAIAAYAFVCGHARWVRPESRVPRPQQVIVALALASAGALAGQAVRQARRFARDYGDRVKPETPA